AISADGARIATAGHDRTVRVWSTAFEAAPSPLPGPSGGTVNGVAFSPDGRLLATACADGLLRVREADTGQDVRLVRAHSPIGRTARAPDQLHVLAGAGAVAYSRDGRWLATGGADGVVRTWDAETGDRLREFQGHRHAVT